MCIIIVYLEMLEYNGLLMFGLSDGHPTVRRGLEWKFKKNFKKFKVFWKSFQNDRKKDSPQNRKLAGKFSKSDRPEKNPKEIPESALR